MKIKQQSFYFSLIIFLSAIIFADPVQIDFQMQMKNNINDTADVFFSHKDINGTSVTIPFDMLRHAKNGGIFLNINGDDGDDFDDQFKKKPRPYFDGDSLWLGDFEDLRGKISDLLDYIELMLNNPEKELTSSQLASALDELEALNNERHRRAAENQQDVTENLLQNSTLDNWRFTHYPGYQKYHPAHSHHETYIVPGILETPREKGGGDSQKAPSNTDSGEASLPSADTNLELGKRTSNGSSDEDDPRQPKKPRDDKSATSEYPKEKQTETVEKEIEVDGKKYTITSELSGIDLDLICMICYDLAGLDGEKCGRCYKHICLKDYNKYLDGKKEALCPSCQSFQLSCFTADPDEMKYKINHLQWFCPKGCGATRDLINIESHIRHCKKAEVGDLGLSVENIQLQNQDEFMSEINNEYWRVKKDNEGCSVELKYSENPFKEVSDEVFQLSPRVIVPRKDGGKFGFLFCMKQSEDGLKLSPYVRWYKASLIPSPSCMQPNMKSLDVPKDRIAFFDHLTMDVSLLDSAGNKISDIDSHTFHFVGEDQKNEDEQEINETHCGNTFLWGLGVSSVVSINCIEYPERFHRNLDEAASFVDGFHKIDTELTDRRYAEVFNMFERYELEKDRLDGELQEKLNILEGNGAGQLEISELKRVMKEEDERAFKRAEDEMNQKFEPEGEFGELVKERGSLKNALDQYLQKERSNCKTCIKHSTERPFYEQWIQQILNSSVDCKNLRMKVEFKSSKNSTE